MTTPATPATPKPTLTIASVIPNVLALLTDAETEFSKAATPTQKRQAAIDAAVQGLDLVAQARGVVFDKTAALAKVTQLVDAAQFLYHAFGL